MVFTSTVFLFAFLPATLAAYYLFPPRMRAIPLLILSSLFYGWGEPVLVVLIWVSSVVNYVLGRMLQGSEGPKRRVLLTVGIAIDLLPLLVFKYLNFVLVTFGMSALAKDIHLPLPIGVSFYTFMAISYLMDVYRRRNTGAPNLLLFAAYLTMFPHLVAGPIVRWEHVGPQLFSPRFNAGRFGYGSVRISTGLVKKSVLADSLSPVVDTMFATGAPTSMGAAWLAALLYSLQIYLDFSAYSDIAIGLAAMLGVDFEENFRYPYLSRSAREFWQRWHISLGSWFRDYVYIPLGGSRVRPALVWRNLLIVWALTGLWHGAAWTFICWGLYFGVLIGCERGRFGRLIGALPLPLQHIYGVLVAVLGWVIFRAADLGQVGQYYKAMFGLAGLPLWDVHASFAFAQTAVVAAISVLLAFGIARKLMDGIERFMTHTDPTLAVPIEHHASDSSLTPGSLMEKLEVSVEESPVRRITTSTVIAIMVALLLILGTAFVVSVTYSPFIYFRF
jgi:alginate O-acetyltransferase complex protein AlgI